MKKAVANLPVFLLGMFLVFVSGCVTDPLETCEEDEICDGKFVQACCTDTRCYYVYNGVEYGDDAASVAQLAADLGCAVAKTEDYDKDIDDLILRLEALGEIARTQVKE
jgi:hypothetical protein